MAMVTTPTLPTSSHMSDGQLPAHEEHLKFRELALRLPTKPHVDTIKKWANPGIRNQRTGKLCTLKSRKIGGILYTTWERYLEFDRQLNEG